MSQTTESSVEMLNHGQNSPEPAQLAAYLDSFLYVDQRSSHGGRQHVEPDHLLNQHGVHRLRVLGWISA